MGLAARAGAFNAVNLLTIPMADAHAVALSARKCPTDRSHQPLEGQIGGPPRHGVVADIDQSPRLEVAIDEAPQIGLGLLADP